MEIIARIDQLRKAMVNAGIQAYIINGADPHLSEYVPMRWKTREWISGFTGSYGQVVITNDKAALWTDSRYFLQAELELENTGIEMVRDRVPDSRTREDWLAKELKSGDVVGVDETCLSLNEYKQLNSTLNSQGIEICPIGDLLENIWSERPEFPSSPVFEWSNEFAGISRVEKFRIVKREIQKEGADLLLISALDELCWTFNLRGEDISYNPVFMGFGIISEGESMLFIKENKVSIPLKTQLESDGVVIRDYEQFYSFLKNIDKTKKVWFNPLKTNLSTYNSLSQEVDTVETNTPIDLIKACKNKVEIGGMEKAHKKDGVAMVSFLHWLKTHIGKEEIFELTVAEKLLYFRSKQSNFKGESFNSIVGYNAHGAIVHYTVSEESNIQLQPEGFLLVDSGGQYLDGTTDITRTIVLGPVSDQMKKDFTLVLKGMINLSMARFLEGTKGANLDILARNALWKEGLNYGHGTGHGVGAFLCVHEGPASIRQDFNEIPIQQGMILSNEPGLYRAGEYGIRTENLVCCKQWKETDFGSFLEFETLTLCPIDRDAILPELLTQEELIWLNQYHQRVFNELSPLLDEELRKFLEEITQPLN